MIPATRTDHQNKSYQFREGGRVMSQSEQENRALEESAVDFQQAKLLKKALKDMKK